jgi:hypothetical protein
MRPRFSNFTPFIMVTVLIQSLLPTAPASAQQIRKDCDSLPPASYAMGHRTTNVRENNLAPGNPGHWNSYSQSPPPKRLKTKAPNVSLYVKPHHVSLPLTESQIWQMKTEQAAAQADSRTRTGTTMLSYKINYGVSANQPSSRTKTGKTRADGTTGLYLPAPQI